MALKLNTRFSLASLEHSGFYISDLPGKALDQKPLHFLHFTLSRAAAPLPPLESMLPVVLQYIKEKAAGDKDRPLHLYYLDGRGQGLISIPLLLDHPLIIPMAGNQVSASPVAELTLHRSYSAVGLKGEHRVVFKEPKDVFTAVEKFLGSYTLGWSGLLHYQTKAQRVQTFDEFYPFKTGFFHPGERLSNLVFRMSLSADSPAGPIFFREVLQNIEEATLEEALVV